MNNYKISLECKILESKFASYEKVIEDENIKQIAFILNAKILNKTKSKKEFKKDIKKYIKERNFVSMFFRLERNKYVGTSYSLK